MTEPEVPPGAAPKVKPVRVFISYAHDTPEHAERVRDLWLLLRALGIDAKIDRPAAERRQDWPLWMLREIRAADFIVVVPSPAYKQRAEGDADVGEGRGVQFEAMLLRNEVYRDPEAALGRVLPVLLPRGSADDIPDWLEPISSTHYPLDALTAHGVERLLRVLTGQVYETEPPLGKVPVLAPRSVERPADGSGGGDAGAALRSLPLSTEVLLRVAVVGDEVSTSVTVSGTLLGERTARLPELVRSVRGVTRAGAISNQALHAVGAALGEALLAVETRTLLGVLADRLRPRDRVDVVLVGQPAALWLPIELLPLKGSRGVDLGPLALRSGVTITRRIADAGDRDPVSPAQLAGPVKVLAAVAAPDEALTASSPLDVEAEMQAVLDCTADLIGQDDRAQVQILEVASLPQIRQAVQADAYHVLHLSAHGSPDSVELTDEDGHPVLTRALDLTDALRRAERIVPLVVLSSCSSGDTSTAQTQNAGPATEAIALGLLSRGADRVLAMQAPVSEGYATALAEAFYRELAAGPDRPTGVLLAQARQQVEGDRREHPSDGWGGSAEWWVPVLFSAGDDLPLVAPGLDKQPLQQATQTPSGRSVRELPVGRLIGRRPQLRTASNVLRRTPPEEYGAATGVLLTGTGGIGKTALAGRLMSRCRAEGWTVALHEGRWNPTALWDAVTEALVAANATRSGSDPGAAQAAAVLSDPERDDATKMQVVQALVAKTPLLIVFDDFEQNLSRGGDAFLDPGAEELFTSLCDAARTGALLVTCRHPLPDDDRLLVEIPVPALSPAELQRLFRRLPALLKLPPEDRRLIARTIGGHPRLIEFTDALLRGGHPGLRDTADKFRKLAKEYHVDLKRPRQVGLALDQAVLLGSADILLQDLVSLLTPSQYATLLQVSVSRASYRLADLAYALDGKDANNAQLDPLKSDVWRLTDLTMLTNNNEEISIHPWVAHAVQRNSSTDLRPQHERALAVRMRLLAQGTWNFEDLLDAGQHLARLERYDDLLGLCESAVQVLSGTLTRTAFLGEMRPLIPDEDTAFLQVADMEQRSLLAVGQLGAARDVSALIHQNIETRVQATPDDPSVQSNLSVSHGRLGDLAIAAGDLATARTQYTAALTIAERLAAAEPTNPEWQRDLSISHNNLGDLAVAAGDLATARTQLTAALTIRERLAAADPTNTTSQRDLGISHERLGTLAVTAGNLATAHTQYTAALTIAERLAAADPTNTTWQRDLSINHDRLGDLAVDAGDLATARTQLTAALTIRERLAAADPTNSTWQRDLSISHNKLGFVAVAAGDPATARTQYTADLAIAERLAAADPTNTEWQRDLTVSHNTLGDLAVGAGDLATAHTQYTAALTIRERLAAADPTNTTWRRDLSLSHERLGTLAVAAGDLATAHTQYTAALTIRKRLAAADPTNTTWRRDLSLSHERLGDLAVAAGDPATAYTQYTAALTIAERLAAADPSNTQWQRDLTVVQQRLDSLAPEPPS